MRASCSEAFQYNFITSIKSQSKSVQSSVEIRFSRLNSLLNFTVWVSDATFWCESFYCDISLCVLHLYGKESLPPLLWPVLSLVIKLDSGLRRLSVAFLKNNISCLCTPRATLRRGAPSCCHRHKASHLCPCSALWFSSRPNREPSAEEAIMLTLRLWDEWGSRWWASVLYEHSPLQACLPPFCLCGR